MKSVIILAMALILSVEASGQEAAKATEEVPPGWWSIPKTSTRFKLGGYVKLDVIHDFDPIGSPDYFDVSTIPTDGSKGKSTHLHARNHACFWISARHRKSVKCAHM
jgi:hypothetical protein